MIAADTSTWVAFLGGDAGDDVALLDRALADGQVAMPPAVMAELLSDPRLPQEVSTQLVELPLLALASGYWERAGRLRAKVLARGRKARLGDALIAQACLDHDLRLITRDADFRAFSAAAALRLLAP